MITEEIIINAEHHNIDALVELDKQGFIIGAKEAPIAYFTRIKQILSGVKEIEEQLNKNKCFIIQDDENKKENFCFQKDDLIPSEIYKEATHITQSLYNFNIDWVFGFFQDCGVFFGGGTYFFPKRNLSLFVINKAFKERSKWFIYHRNELLAHELCHVSRMGFNEIIYEEHLAYQTSQKNKFRQNWGGVIYSDKDIYLALFCLMAMITIQLVKVFIFYIAFPIEFLPLLFILWLIIRHQKAKAKLKKIIFLLQKIHCKHPLSVIFRLSDKEILEMSKLSIKTNESEISKAFKGLFQESMRYTVIKTRFF